MTRAAAEFYADAVHVGIACSTLLHEIAHHASWVPDLEATSADLEHYDARVGVNAILDMGQVYEAIEACDAATRRLLDAAIAADNGKIGTEPDDDDSDDRDVRRSYSEGD